MLWDWTRLEGPEQDPQKNVSKTSVRASSRSAGEVTNAVLEEPLSALHNPHVCLTLSQSNTRLLT